MARKPEPKAPEMTDAEWRALALKAASDLLDGTHQQKLIAEAWWRDQLQTPKAREVLHTPHFLPTSAMR